METVETSIFEDLQNEQPLTYADTTLRFVNFIVDLIVAYVIVLAVFVLIGMFVPSFIYFFQTEEISVRLLDRLVTVIMLVAVYTIIEGSSKGKTLGKLITGTRAVTEDGSPITWRNAFIRSISRFVPFEVFSGLSGNPWHDKWSKTCVIKERK